MLTFLLICGALAETPPGTPPSAAPTVEFRRDIAPIFAERCLACHGASKRKGGLRLDRKADALAGGDSGPVLAPGKSDESLLIELVAGENPDEIMPPKNAGAPLSKQQLAQLRAWIDQGAVWPDHDLRAETPQERGHWSFQPIRRPPLPAVRNTGWVRNSVDAFILARLEAEGIAPSPEASRSTLLRRLYLDLTGLLPTPREADAFLNDTRSDAYEQLVDRLLASPHFGERWGRHWLDLARYADSNGYERDDVRPNAWRYRDWVIHAINDDLPFDQFVTQQLAGDLLPGATHDQKTATGFHRMTLTNTESGINKDDYRNREIVDRVNTTGTALLGLTIGCAQCHTHKYDPITLSEYYQFYAYFENTAEVELPLDMRSSERVAYEQAFAQHSAKELSLKRQKAVLDAIAKAGTVDAWQPAVLDRNRREQPKLLLLEKVQGAGPSGWSASWSPEDAKAIEAPAEVRAAANVEAARRSAAERKTLQTYFRSLEKKIAEIRETTLPPADQLAALELPSNSLDAILTETGRRTPAQVALVQEFEQSLSARIDDVGQQIRRLAVEERFLAKPAVMALGESSKDRRITHVRLRGDFKQKGTEVAPRTLEILPQTAPRSAKPDRLDLAAWIVSPDQPLTARVAVNHAWAHLFGRGIVATIGDFGTKGDPPSHPDLLDALAAEFRDGWSRKALLRKIVTSATYRQVSRTRPDLDARDPLNRLVARQGRFRVEGEIVRDLFLSASGLLSPQVGGKTIRPVAPASMQDVGYKYKLVWDVSPSPDRYRRGMYVHFMRSNPYPSLVMFDCPESTVCAPVRNRSNTPLQALALLNDPVFLECARSLGRRVVAEGPSDSVGRIRSLGRLTLNRELRDDELEALVPLFDVERAAYAADPASTRDLLGSDRLPEATNPADAAAWTAVARAFLNLDEFLTRE